MSVLVMDCPHCPATNAAFNVIGSGMFRPGSLSNWIVFLQCPACFMPVVANLALKAGIGNFQVITGQIDDPGFCASIEVFPAAPPTDVPENIPDNVARIFKQAAESKKAGHLDAACGMYRKAMELALKNFSPDIEAWKIEKRIDKMAAENRITPELQSWAHELRLDGNDALHGDESASGEMTEQMHGLCKSLLLYLYTLPAQVERAKARRALG